MQWNNVDCEKLETEPTKKQPYGKSSENIRVFAFNAYNPLGWLISYISILANLYNDKHPNTVSLYI